MSYPEGAFAAQVVAWQAQHGRNDLPWQATRDPYRVWLSEIMLQQTQVATVRDYFTRFVARFPTLGTLAEASLDEVLGLWSGLGYYSRARNLHRCAQQIVAQYGGVFPAQSDVLQTLPGIGRSTAAAIASLCFGERVAILDANVRRVVTRVTGFDADVSVAAHVRDLWAQATALLPAQKNAAKSMQGYTQGMMDLGATVCVPKKPDCEACPVRGFCVAAAAGNPQHYPVRSRRLKRSSQSLWLLWAQTGRGAVWLSTRPTPGVWAGLHCMPLFDSEDALRAAVSHGDATQLEPLPVFTHVLTHKDLHLHTWRLQLPNMDRRFGAGRWVSADAWPALGLPAPVRRLLQDTMP